MSSDRPSRPVMVPHPRHRLRAVTQRTLPRLVNSVIDPAVDLAAESAAINRGEAVRQGDRYTVNGRVYGVEEGGRAYPGIYQLSRGAFKALGIYNLFGLTDRSEAILDEMGIESAERLAGREAWRAGRQGRT